MKMPTNMSHKFSEVPEANIPRSVFDRSSTYKTTLNAGFLVPFYVDEVLPGDTFNLDATLFARMNTPVTPVMDNLYLETFWFFTPLRILWTNYDKFFGAQVDPGDSISYTIPQIVSHASNGWEEESLGDYFGLPVAVTSLSTNTLPFRAYNLIFNEWFRDQNLDDSVTVDVDDGPDTESDYVLLKRRKKHDYFTSCLPWPQKGDEVELPIGDDAPVYGIGPLTTTYGATSVTAYEANGTGGTIYAKAKDITGDTNDQILYVEEDPNRTGYPHIFANLSAATAASINELREAFQTQKLLERDARSGTRYCEVIKSHFGVTSPMDAVLQRPEYLGGSSDPVVFTPVANTSDTTNHEQGRLVSTGSVGARGSGFVKSFTEHGYIIGIVNIRADITYQQGLDRMWSRSTRYDFYYPAFAHLGEQSVLKQEIYCDGSATDDDVFGYQERWAEYRYKPSKITGILRSTAGTSLDIWHLSQEFGSVPTLNTAFITDGTEAVVERCIATAAEPQFTMDSFIRCKCARPLPLYSVPGFIDRF